MNETDLITLILDELRQVCAELGVDTAGLDADSVLFGDGSLIDSMALVGLIIKVEEHVLETTGQEIQVIDDAAIIADGQTPFRSPRTLAAHVLAKTTA
ncbi:hypothetical protein [Pseudaquabacterium pictum]|jgi:acyl carrier protein|uniref:hypothetical protein n=1 Tax=Pseudaquabacterium pictum TaxID=2315236 RepID=UPI001396C7A1|nr:hypothetical protein [Rubrivivax pictus]